MPFELVPLDMPIQGPRLLEPRVFGDERGFFLETYHRRDFQSLGIPEEFVQDNQSRSRRGTLRGLHFQREHPQAKLVRVLRGRVFDVAVDLRAGSPTEGRWCGVELDDVRRRVFYIPAGFAHGFLALSEEADLAYKCSDSYRAEDEGGLVWNDPRVDIAWPLAELGAPLLSAKDLAWPGLDDLTFRFRSPPT
jgi:dTDP-4-dehydrorhamnose 3,5-epimerase